jgi:hypothetical protein
MGTPWSTRPVGRAIGVFAAAFLVLLVAGFAGMRRIPALAFARQEVPPVRTADPTWTPVFFRGGAQLDQTILWNDIGSFMENARRADVLFVGNSQMQFALPAHELRAFTKRTGRSAFTMGLPFSEPCSFALELIEKFDLRPRLVVANIAGFFRPGRSRAANAAVRDGYWTGLTTVWEERLAAAVWPAASLVLPSFVTTRPAQSLLRSSANGAWMPVHWPHGHLPARSNKPLMVDFGLARRFRDALAARGTRLALVCIPSFAGDCGPESVQPLATKLGVWSLAPHVDGPLWTADLVHLCPLSGKRYGRALLRDVADLPVFRASSPDPASAIASSSWAASDGPASFE